MWGFSFQAIIIHIQHRVCVKSATGWASYVKSILHSRSSLKGTTTGPLSQKYPPFAPLLWWPETRRECNMWMLSNLYGKQVSSCFHRDRAFLERVRVVLTDVYSLFTKIPQSHTSDPDRCFWVITLPTLSCLVTPFIQPLRPFIHHSVSVFFPSLCLSASLDWIGPHWHETYQCGCQRPLPSS